jgi:hypothetical protein
MAAQPVPPASETRTARTASNPFLGLRRFEIDDTALFFGRDDQTFDLLRRLRLLHFIAVIGPSGCGKSSLIRAGVLAALRNGYWEAGKSWKIAMLQPGNGPLEAWTTELKRYLRPGLEPSKLLEDPAAALDTSNGRIVILVDQFEELFEFGKRTGRGRDVQTFLEAMLATGARDSNIYVIFTMRSEYLAQCALYPKLSEAINEGLYLVPRMTRDQMREAIVRPIQISGSAITAPLVDRLLNEASSESDGLPVLQHALMRMWSKKKAWEPLGLNEYEATRGLGAFLNDHADDVFKKLGIEQQRIAELLFCAITERTEDGRAVRRAMELDAISGQAGYPSEKLQPVIDKFKREGFLIVTPSPRSPSPLVDISHEAVARQWKKLEGWMTAEARHRRALKRLADDAKEWDAQGRKRDYLLHGLQFDNVYSEVIGHESSLDPLQKAFLDASRRAKRLSWLSSWKVFVPGLTALLVFGSLAYEAKRQAFEASTQAMMATAQAEVARDQTKTAESERKKTVQALAEARKAQTEAASVVRKSAQSYVSPTAAQTPRVYIQISSEQQRTQARMIQERIKRAGFLAPGVELLSVGPNRTELRYFKKSDETEAQQIAKTIASAGAPPTVVLVPGFEQSATMRPKHYELWLASPRASAE